MCSWLGPWLNNETKNIKYPVGAAVALGGGRDRQVAAAQAIANKEARMLWVTGPELDISLDPQEGDLFLVHMNGTTWTDAEDTLRVIMDRNPGPVVIYTSDYHIRRAQMTFNWVADHTYHAKFNIQWKAVPNAFFKLEDWYKTSQGRSVVMNEYLGILSVLARRK